MVRLDYNVFNIEFMYVFYSLIFSGITVIFMYETKPVVIHITVPYIKTRYSSSHIGALATPCGWTGVSFIPE